MLNVEEYFKNKEKLENAYDFHIYKKNLEKERHAKSLVHAHLDKAKHNLAFVNQNIKNGNFQDWSIVGLYYAVYHAALALVSRKGFISRSHNATMIFLIKNYTNEFIKEELRLIDELSITKKDATFYTSLKSERQKASYSTDIMFSESKVLELQKKSIDFINKVEDIIES
uniref:HEPN domain protein n=1 Tax=Methanococcus maripaludis (strain C6 / ATCC BAA-1332) TaxID=444158 RepID=A9A773_METM6